MIVCKMNADGGSVRNNANLSLKSKTLFIQASGEAGSSLWVYGRIILVPRALSVYPLVPVYLESAQFGIPKSYFGPLSILIKA